MYFIKNDSLNDSSSFLAGGPKVEDEDEPEPPEDFEYLDDWFVNL